MGKSLSEMSLEELWQLFPIILTEHKDCWKQWYAEEEQHIKEMLPAGSRINHIGSTAIDSSGRSFPCIGQEAPGSLRRCIQ